MTAITTRAGKGSPLTNAEVDANFTGLNDGKLEKSSNLSDLANAATARTNLGLGNVNNTSDANKPISTATQTALNAKENTANKGVANGYAGLDATGKVPAAQLPSYVDDVLEYANLAAFPVTGEAGKIYVALDTNKTYRWSGSAYVYITSGAVDSVAGKTGVVTLAKADVGLGSVDNTSDANKPISTATKLALDGKAPSTHVGETGTAHGVATTLVAGFMSAADKSKLDGVAANANNYSHPTGDGNLHVPATGTTNNGKVLKAGATAESLSWGTLAKADVGLGNVDNTSDANKPISTATQAALDTKAPLSHVSATGAAHGVVTVSVAGFMSSADKTKLDGVAISANNYTHPSGDGNLHVPATGTTNSGKVLKAGATAGSLSWGTLAKADVGLSNVANTTDLDKPISTATQTALDGKSAVGHNHDTAYEAKNANIQSHITSTFNPHGVTKSQVGLSNVDNTADVAKPISTTQQAALNLKADLAGAAFTGASSVTANSASAALTVKQTGSGNALVVEDSASPDSTPFVIDASGNVLVGSSTPLEYYGRSALGVKSDEGGLLELSDSTGGHSIIYRDRALNNLSIEARSTNASVSLSANGAGVITCHTGGSERMRINRDGGVSIGTTAESGASALRVVNTLLTNDRLEINGLGTGNRYAYIDLVGDDTYTDYGVRLIRDNAGANASSQLISRGTGPLYIKTVEAGDVVLATSSVERMRIGSNGFVSIGNHSAISKLDIGATDNANEGAEVKLRGATNASVDWNFDVYRNTFRLFTTDKGAAANWQERLLVSHDGTLVQIGSAAYVGHIIRNAYGSGTVNSHSYIDFRNEADVATGSIINVHNTDGSSRIDFSTTAAGARTFDRRSPALQIYGNGAVLAINPNGGLGYGTGAGGTVTQATSKSTAVTLNKPTGRITMNNAALAAGAVAEFIVNNSLVSANDVVVLSIASGVSSFTNYRIWSAVQGNGQFVVDVENRTGGALSEAVVINFAIIKGAIA